MNIRESARLVLLNDDNRLFLFEHNSPVPENAREPHILRYWVTPGGGVEAGETWDDAARREMWEETGIECALGPWIWSREKAVTLNGEEILGRERYYLVRCGRRAISNANQMDQERRVYQRHHWWSLAELRDTDDIVFPVGLTDLIAPIIDGHVPDEPVRLLE